jgi:hypothetical protein
MLDFVSPPGAAAIPIEAIGPLLGAPRAGRSLGGQVTAINGPIREAVAHLAAHPAHPELEKLLRDSTRVPKNLGGVCEPMETRAAWFIVTASLMGVRFGKPSPLHSLECSLAWFMAETGLAARVKAHYGRQWKHADRALRNAQVDDHFWALLPYVLEPEGHVTRTEFETCPLSRERKAKKRSSGAFYTPGDVAKFMAASVFMPGATWLDPACGTGVFLRSVIETVREQEPAVNLREFIQSQLYAIDLSALATDLASFVVLAQLLRAPSRISPVSLWREIKQNVLCADAQKIRPGSMRRGDLFSSSTQEEFQSLFGNECAGGFDVVIMNPPYATAHLSVADSQSWDALPPGTTRVDAQIIFTEMMWKFSTERGRAVAVLPLSVGANTSTVYRSLRREIARAPGRKTFLFFDREPQALFGEDIKTRNVILLIDKQHTRSEIHTSGMLKWTAEQRTSILSFDRATPLGSVGVDRFVPKLSSETERAVYTELLRCVDSRTPRVSTCRTSLSDALGMRSCQDVFVAGTAYNFLNVFRADGLPASELVPLSSSPLNRLIFAGASASFAALAILASRLMFWLWHVEGDGFHVSAEFLERSPLWLVLGDRNATHALAASGRRYWAEARSMAVRSLNGGKATFSFHTGYGAHFYSEVDQLMLDALGIERSTEFLDHFIAAMVHVGGIRRDRRQKSS